MDRKKIILHLFPGEHKQDHYAMNIIDVQKTGKGEFYRNCFLAGLALSKIDSRLPTVLSNVLDETVDINTLINSMKLLNLIGDTQHKSIEPELNVDDKTCESTQKARNLFLGE